MATVRVKKNGLAQARAQREAAIAAAQVQSCNILKPGSPPPRLNKLTGKALEYWRYMVDEAPEGHFTITDGPLLANYCRLMARSDMFAERMEREDLTVDTEYGERINPYWTGFLKMQVLVANINARLRLAPGSRQGATIIASEPDKGKGSSKTKQPPSRAHLLFGGARVAAQVAANEAEDED